MSDSFFERTHGIFGRDGLGSNNIGYLEVQRNIFSIGMLLVTKQHLGIVKPVCRHGNLHQTGRLGGSGIQTATRRLLNLLVKGSVRPRRPPAHHFDGAELQFLSRGDAGSDNSEVKSNGVGDDVVSGCAFGRFHKNRRRVGRWVYVCYDATLALYRWVESAGERKGTGRQCKSGFL